jgi:hypothetical protein
VIAIQEEEEKEEEDDVDQNQKNEIKTNSVAHRGWRLEVGVAGNLLSLSAEKSGRDGNYRTRR